VPHRVEWTPPPLGFIARLPPRVALAVLTFVDQRLADPSAPQQAIVRRLSHLRSARHGDYRVLFRLDDDASVLWIVRASTTAAMSTVANSRHPVGYPPTSSTGSRTE